MTLCFQRTRERLESAEKGRHVKKYLQMNYKGKREPKWEKICWLYKPVTWLAVHIVKTGWMVYPKDYVEVYLPHSLT